QVGGGLVKRLEGRQSPNAVIDAARAPTDIRDSINPPGPFEMAGEVVFLRPFPFQKRLGFAIALLLAQISANGIAAMVPDDRRGIEHQRPTLLLQTPTDIHVVTGDAKLRVKSANRLQARLAERHIAARNVFRLAIGKQDV